MGKKKRHHRIHREGRGIIVTLTFLIFAVNVPIYLYMSNWIFAITLLLSAVLLVFVTYFFRNPRRILEVSDPNLLIAPADG
jgi:phosphatidylserine decarboxylase